jgi:Cu/Ag efflux protein CusF
MSSFDTVFTTDKSWHLFVLFSVSLLLALTACNSHQGHPRNGRYQLQGDVVSIDKSHRDVVVKHGEIPGLMPAMTMPYEVADENVLDKLAPGTPIRADVIVNGESIRLENITVVNRRGLE